MSIRAIAVDTSAFHKGELNLEEIERWTGACHEHDAEFWIPDIVAHELAHHTCEAEYEFLSKLNSGVRNRAKKGLSRINVPPPPTMDDIISAIAETGADILELTGEIARDAIFDQVDQTGPAERKRGTKTGSSDSAWVRTLSHKASSIDEGDIILVCNDRGARAFLESPELKRRNIRIVSNFGEIMALLGEDSPTDPDDVAPVLASLTDELQSYNSPLMEYGDLPLDSDTVDHRLGVHAEDFELQDRHIENVETLGEASDILYNAWTGSHYGTIEVSFTVRESYVAQDWLGASLLLVYAIASSKAEVSFRAYPDALTANHMTIEIDELQVDDHYEDAYLEYGD